MFGLERARVETECDTAFRDNEVSEDFITPNEEFSNIHMRYYMETTDKTDYAEPFENKLNRGLLDKFTSSDLLWITGQLNHCKNTNTKIKLMEKIIEEMALKIVEMSKE